MVKRKARLSKAQRREKLIQRSGKILSRANRAWRRGDMKTATELTTKFKQMSKRIDKR